MVLRFKLPSTLAVTLLCSCHASGHPVTDALGDAPITDARVIPIDAGTADGMPADAVAGDAPADAGVDAGVDAMVVADAPVQPDAAVPDAAVPDAMPDADLG
jgi:hypothetical protein